jgi:AraC-like DNA-binding protein
MEPSNHEQPGQDTRRLQAGQQELVARIGRALPEDGLIEPLAGVHLARVSKTLAPLHSVYEPCFCVIAQGSKEVLLGDSRYQYDPWRYLLVTLDLPLVSQVMEATRERPYLSFRLNLDPQLVSSVMAEAGYTVSPRSAAVARAIDVSRLDADLLDAVVRLIRLVDTPAEAPILMPMIVREIVYRLLRSEQGSRLHHLAVMAGSDAAIARAVQRIRQEFDQPLRVEQLAGELGMSVSSFHHHFKAVTAISPMQFQKLLRLQEARRLMLSENSGATNAAYRVGYRDPAHFSREYKSVFGIPPMRDVQQLRQTAGAVSGH